MFADYLDPLTADGRYRLVLLDQRAQGRSDRGVPPETWTLEQMASDVSAVAADLGAERYAVLGHSYGAFVALQHAVDAPGGAVATIVSGGLPSASYLSGLDAQLESFEPVALRERVTRSWRAEPTVSTDEDALALVHDQLPFHFRDPQDPRISEYAAATADMRVAAAVLRHFAGAEYGGIEVRDRLHRIPQPLLACTGRYDRVCPPAAATEIAQGAPRGELVIFEESGHLSFVEEPQRYHDVVADFLDRAGAA